MILKKVKYVVLDADALTSFKDDLKSLYSLLDKNKIITPHLGEFNKIFAQVTGGMWVEVFALRKPFPLKISVFPGISLLKKPGSVNIENGKGFLSDYEYTLMPSISLGIVFPK